MKKLFIERGVVFFYGKKQYISVMKKIIVFVFLLSTFSIFSQTTQSGDIVEEINTIISSLPSAGGLEYSAPTFSQKADAIDELINILSVDFQIDTVYVGETFE